MTRHVLLVAHTRRPAVLREARLAARLLTAAGMTVRVLERDTHDLAPDGVVEVARGEEPARGCEVVIVLGGDGTLLRGVELARPSRTPLIGVNLGHVGFLAEAERDALTATVERIVHREYVVEERLTLDVVVRMGPAITARNWALNEASVEKGRNRVLEVVLEVDGRPVSRWGGDGVVCATPTGSTAYAFSAGGPVVWPEVQALLLVPVSAHALFARPMVVSPSSVLAVEVLHRTEANAVLWCDGRRMVPLPPGARVEVRHGTQPVRLARLHQAPFTDRLVEKFHLPVSGWRGAPPDGGRA